MKELLGAGEALQLMAEVGGTTVWVPLRAQGSKLETLVGAKTARALSEHYPGEALRIPMGLARGRGARNRRARELLRQGLSVTEVARATEMHETTIQRIKRQEMGESDPTPLQYRLDL
ncbi:MAG: hypothetical protein ACU0CO_10245 [Shimia sp.]